MDLHVTVAEAEHIGVDTPEEAREKSKSARGGKGERAVLYRMATDEHLCPFGLKAKSLLERRGFEVMDEQLTSRAETDAFQKAHDVETTPQSYIDGKRIGGYDALRRHFGLSLREDSETTYAPIIALFLTTAFIAFAVVYNFYDEFPVFVWLKWFIAFSMCALAIQKLQDVEGFVTGFLGYDLLARKYVPYGYFYPYGEAWAGIGMIALIGSDSSLIWLVAPVAIFIGTIGAVSVLKAVYIDRRKLKCVCLGAKSRVPLGAISLIENLMMVGIGLWMLLEWRTT